MKNSTLNFCGYEKTLTAKVNEMARQHSERACPALCHVNGACTGSYRMGVFIAGLSTQGLDDSPYYYLYRVNNCDTVQYPVSDAVTETNWFNTADELRAILARITAELTGKAGTAVIAYRVQKDKYLDSVIFLKVTENGDILPIVNSDVMKYDFAFFDTEHPVRTYGDNTYTLYLNPADMAEDLAKGIEKHVSHGNDKVHNAFDIRRKELGTADDMLSAIRKAQGK
jgi:hypothetical protein